MNAGANWFGDDIRIVEAVFLEDVDVRVDLGVIRSILSRIVGNGVDEIMQVDDIRECWLSRYIEGVDRRLFVFDVCGEYIMWVKCLVGKIVTRVPSRVCINDRTDLFPNSASGRVFR